MTSREPTDKAAPIVSDTAAAIGDDDHVILLGREVIDRVEKVIKRKGARLESLDENSPEYERELDKFAEIIKHYMEFKELQARVEEIRLGTNKTKER